MSAMEQSLRRALEAGDATDPAFRESIYSASERALERMLAAKALDADAAQAQRIRLAETINRVEDDYFTAEGDQAETGTDAAPEHEAAWEVAANGSETDTAPSMEEPVPADHAPDPSEHGPDGMGHEVEPHPAGDAGTPLASAAAAQDGRAETWSPGAGRRSEEPRAKGGRLRPFLFGLVVLLLAIIGGVVFFYATVFGDMGSVTTNGVPAAAATDPTEGAATPAVAWISLFDGTQLEAIATPTGGDVSAVTGAGDRPAVRLAAAGADGEVDVSIGPGVVNTIKGSKVRVEITAGSGDGQAREFGVRCLFGGDTVCGRQRFMTLQSSEAFVFDMTVPANPSASGTIAIDPSFGTAAKDIDLYSVRLRSLDDV